MKMSGHDLPLFSKILILLICGVLCTAIPSQSFSQVYKHANIWYFGDSVGMDFNTGYPVVLYDGVLFTLGTSRGAVAMSDTNGSLLFYSNGLSIWNKQHQPMDLSFMASSYDVVSFPKSGSDHEYFVFSVPNYFSPILDRIYYSVIDMSLNGGLGGAGDPVKLTSIPDPGQKITATRHKNNSDTWVVLRKISAHYYASILVSAGTVAPEPILSPAPSFEISSYIGSSQLEGQIKISYDNDYLVYTNLGDISSLSYDYSRIEVCKFDDGTGLVDYLYTLQLKDPSLTTSPLLAMGVEFSPDSRYLYLSGVVSKSDTGFVYQLDMNYIEDSAGFLQSRVLVGLGKRFFGMQLARDGKIYITSRHAGSNSTPYLSVIHDPWKNGTGCNFEAKAIYLSPRNGRGKLTNVFPYFLFRFDYEGHCEGVPIQFDPWFVPEPDYIEWNFGDPASGPNNTSTIPDATHVFTDGGTYKVSVYVEYPDGRIEETSREIEIDYMPEPDLGPDTFICTGGSVILDAYCGPYLYSWSTGAIGTSQITVSDTGWYWVRARNDEGCWGTDSIHIAFYPSAVLDTFQLQISPTTCGGNMGVVKGLQAVGVPPFFYHWTDDMGDTIAQSLDIYHLPVGNYTLHVTDGNDCRAVFGPFTIHDAGDVLIEEVHYTPDYCGQQSGSITVTAVSGLSDMLFYSIDNGANYYANEGVFTGLPGGSYALRVKDSSDCQDVYEQNPLILENLPGPQINQVNITPSLAGQNNGAIEILAVSPCDTLYYSNDNGSSFQVNDGWFPGLAPGFYTCVVLDEYGCDTAFTVEVIEETALSLQAVAGDDEVCPGNTAFVPLTVTNFQDVASFRANLLFNNALLQCQGYANTHPNLEDSIQAVVFPAEGRIEVTWSSNPLTLPQQSTIADLVFASVDPGTSLVDWDGQPGAGYFRNDQGGDLPVDYHTGEVKVYNNVSFYLQNQLEACQGEDIFITPQLLSSNGDVTYLWTSPSGDTSSNMTHSFLDARPQQSGIYHLLVVDTAQCHAEEVIQLTVHENPHPDISPQDTLITEEPLELDAGSGYLYYLWSTGETNRQITAESHGWYTVEVESAQGCMGADSVYVLFLAPPPPIEPRDDLVHFPNAFSPNGDGLNDEFRATAGSDITRFHMRIYSRWGELIFESHDLAAGWDGQHNGRPAREGMYVYTVEYSIGDVAKRTANGHVLLLR